MKVGKTRIKLAELLEAKLDTIVNPEDLKVNRGANQYNDWCSWFGRVGPCKDVHVSSWDTMANIVKRGKVHIVSNEAYNIEVS